MIFDTKKRAIITLGFSIVYLFVLFPFSSGWTLIKLLFASYTTNKLMLMKNEYDNGEDIEALGVRIVASDTDETLYALYYFLHSILALLVILILLYYE